MQDIEHVVFNNHDVAIVFRSSLEVDGVRFFTNDNNLFQIGAHHQKKGVKLVPHTHVLEKSIVINEIQEYLFVQSGKMKITLYSKAGDVIDQKILSSGDSILLMNEGHGIEFLEETKLMEVKQGPYPGTTHAKLYLKNVHNTI